MKYVWKCPLIDYQNIEKYLNIYEMTGWEIFSIIYDNNISHPAMIVMRKKATEVAETSPKRELSGRKISTWSKIKSFFRRLYGSFFG